MGVVGGPDPIVTDGLVLYVDAANTAKSFTPGTTTWSDMSGLENNLTLINSPGSGSNPASINTIQSDTSYLTFDQNGAAEVTSTAQSGYGGYTGEDNTNYTFDLWMNTSDNSTATHGKGIIGNPNNNLYSQLAVRNDKVQFLRYVSSWQYFSGTTTITDGNWHHVVFVNNSNQTGDIYIDGQQEANGSTAMANGKHTKIIRLGSGWNTTGTSGYLTAQFAQVKVYDRALTAAEILQNYNSAKDRFV
jgi:hypothetical protein